MATNAASQVEEDQVGMAADLIEKAAAAGVELVFPVDTVMAKEVGPCVNIQLMMKI